MLDYAALGILIFAFITLFYGIIVIHDIPYEIAVHRNHPHQEAIHYAGWISLFTIGAIWPFLWIWATLYRVDRGWGFDPNKGALAAEPGSDDADSIVSLRDQVKALEDRIDFIEQSGLVTTETSKSDGGVT